MAEPAITSYLVYLVKEGGVEQIYFFLAQHAAKSCPVLKNLVDFTKLQVDIQKKWFESCLEELKLLKDKNVYKVVDLPKKWKVIKNCWVFNNKSDDCYRSVRNNSHLPDEFTNIV